MQARNVRHRCAVAGPLIALLGALFVTVAPAASAGDPQAALTRLFTEPHVQADWFAASFLAQVPATQIETILGQLKSQLGAFKSISQEGAKYRVNFERGNDLASVVLDSDGRISGLFFESPLVYAASFQSAVEAFTTLPGRVSLYVTGKQHAAVSAQAPLAVGSTFKLAVLKALDDAVTARKTSWSAIVKLDGRRKSLPSGVLQTWPDGSPISVDTYAALMISQSDNTAADTMLMLAGRNAAERYGPRNKPFLTTREAFILKDPHNAAVLARYRAADVSGRRRMLAEIDALPLPDASVFSGAPQDTDIEWFFTTAELCALLSSVQQLPFMSINPGVAEASDWSRVAYKGGSEPGVLNLTTWLVAKDGSSYCVSATWNDDKELDDLKFFGLYKSLLSTLKS